jgi:peptide deformylase
VLRPPNCKQQLEERGFRAVGSVYEEANAVSRGSVYQDGDEAAEHLSSEITAMIEIPKRERLLIYGPQMINHKCEDVGFDEYDSLSGLQSYMLSIMRKNNGVGIAAPQVGVFKNFFVMQTRNQRIIGVVNPEVIRMYGHEIDGFEACLSIPPVGNGCKVARPQKLRIEFGMSDNPGLRNVYELQGMDSVVAQHEIDHLTGTFFVDRVNDVRQKEVLRLFESWRIKQSIYLATKEKGIAENCSRPFTADCR